MVIVLANDGFRYGDGIRVVEFDTLDQADDWIDEQLAPPIEGVGTRTRKMYRVFVGEEIQPTKGTE